MRHKSELVTSHQNRFFPLSFGLKTKYNRNNNRKCTSRPAFSLSHTSDMLARALAKRPTLNLFFLPGLLGVLFLCNTNTFNSIF